MSTPLEGRRALVTGGGIGLAVAEALREAGADVVVTYRTHIPAAGLHGIQVDAVDEAAVAAAAVEQAADRSLSIPSARRRGRGPGG